MSRVFDTEDTRATSYVLGELSGEELRAFEQELGRNAELRKQVEAVRATVAALSEELQAEPCPRLTPQQRERIHSPAGSRTRSLWSRWRIPSLVSASAVVVIGFYAYRNVDTAPPARVTSMETRASAPAPDPQSAPKPGTQGEQPVAADALAGANRAVKENSKNEAPAQNPAAAEAPTLDSVIADQTPPAAAPAKRPEVIPAAKPKPSAPRPLETLASGKAREERASKELAKTRVDTEAERAALDFAPSGAAAETRHNAAGGAGPRSDLADASIAGSLKSAAQSKEEDAPAARIAAAPPAPAEKASVASAPADHESKLKIGFAPDVAVADQPVQSFEIAGGPALDTMGTLQKGLSRNEVNLVSAEGLINSQRYTYPEPVAAEAYSITTEIHPAPWNSAHYLARVGLRSKKPFPTGAPLRVSFDPTTVRSYRYIGDDRGTARPSGSYLTLMYELIPQPSRTAPPPPLERKLTARIHLALDNSKRPVSPDFRAAAAAATFTLAVREHRSNLLDSALALATSASSPAAGAMGFKAAGRAKAAKKMQASHADLSEPAAEKKDAQDADSSLADIIRRTKPLLSP